MSLTMEELKQALREEEQQTNELDRLKAERLQLNNDLKRQKLKELQAKEEQTTKIIKHTDYTIIFSLITITISILLSLLIIFYLVLNF